MIKAICWIIQNYQCCDFWTAASAINNKPTAFALPHSICCELNPYILQNSFVELELFLSALPNPLQAFITEVLKLIFEGSIQFRR